MILSGDLRVVDSLPHVFVAMQSGRWQAPGGGWSGWLLVRNSTLRLALKESRILHRPGDKMVSILISFVKLIGHFLLCKTCPVYHTANSLDRNNSDMYQLVSIVPTLRQLLHSRARMTWSSMSKVNHLQFMEQLPDILQSRARSLFSVEDWLEKCEHPDRQERLISRI